MNKRIAELWAKEITGLLSGKKLTVLEIVHGQVPHIRFEQSFVGASVVEHAGGDCVVMVNDSYGTSPGIQEWNIVPCERSVRGTVRRGGMPGSAWEQVSHFVWVLNDKDASYKAMRELSEKIVVESSQILEEVETEKLTARVAPGKK